MITPSFGLTATERVLPKLALDFTTASLDPRITFTRTGNTATVVDSSGYVATINADLPRFDYDPTVSPPVCKGLLIEEARTNLVTYSQAIGGTNWTVQSGATASLNNATSPANTTTATLMTGSSAVATFQSITLATNTSYTVSVFAKAGTSTRSSLGLFDNTGGDFQGRLFITWSGGIPSTQSTQGTVTNVAYTSYGNGWYRITMTTTSDITNTAHRYYFYPDTLATGGTVYIWGAQLEAGTFATSYIPTTTTTLTRNADVATMTGTNFSDWFNASEGTFVVNGSTVNFTNSDVIVDATDGTTSNRIQMFVAGVTGAATTFMATGGATQAQFSAGTVTANTTFTFASGYKVNAIAASLNAATPATDTSATMPSGINTTTLGCRFNGVNQLNGYLRKVNYYPQRLTNAEIQAFSK